MSKEDHKRKKRKELGSIMYPIHYLRVHTVLMLTKRMIQLSARNSILRFYGWI